LISDIPLSIFNNDAGWTSNAGTITGVTGGVGITTAGSPSVTVTLAVNELSERSGALIGSDRLVGATSGGTNFAETINQIPLSIFLNDEGWTSGSYSGWDPGADSGSPTTVGSAHEVNFLGSTYIDTSYNFTSGSPPTHDITISLDTTALDLRYYTQTYITTNYETYANTQTWVNNNFDDYGSWTFDPNTGGANEMTVGSGDKLTFVPGTGIQFNWTGGNTLEISASATSSYVGWDALADGGSGFQRVGSAHDVDFAGGSNITTTYAFVAGSPAVHTITFDLDSNISLTTVTASTWMRVDNGSYYVQLGAETISFTRTSTNYIRTASGGPLAIVTDGRTGSYAESMVYIGTDYVDLKYGTDAITSLKLRTTNDGITVSGLVNVDTYVKSSGNSIVLGTNSTSGTVYLRPNGYLSGSYQLTVSTTQTTVRNKLLVEAANAEVENNFEVGAGRAGNWGVYALPAFLMGSGGVTDEYLVIARKYVGTLRQAHGLNGSIYFQRGGAGSGNAIGRAELVIQCAYNTNELSRFEMHGTQVYTSIDEISISGVAYYALKARTSGGGQALSHKFVGEYYNEDSDSNLLTRVRASDANVSVTTTNVKKPDQMLSTGMYTRGELEGYDTA
jgi:hypothetical protein